MAVRYIFGHGGVFFDHPVGVVQCFSAIRMNICLDKSVLYTYRSSGRLFVIIEFAILGVLDAVPRALLSVLSFIVCVLLRAIPHAQLP